MIINNIANINFGGGGGGSDIKVQDMKIVTQDVNSSGLYDFQPDEGYDTIKILKTNLTIPSTPAQTVDLKTGIKFGNSTFRVMPFTLICDSGVTNMEQMFSYCRNLTTLDVSNFNTINVTSMSYMFSNCDKLTTLNLSSFDTSNVESMGSMFFDCNNLTTLDLSNFNTSKVTNMYSMFNNCDNLTTLNLSNFNTSKVTSMGNMFGYCGGLTTVKVINCDEATKNKILTQLQSDLNSYTWTLGDDGIIRRSEKTA